MARPQVSAEAFARVFGPRETFTDEEPARRRLCKACGGWHRVDEPWPHNCRSPDDRPPQYLSAPLLIHDVEPHRHGDWIITSRNEQREFMRRTGAVEHDEMRETAGTHRQDFASRTYQEDLVQDVKRAMQEDPLNSPPPLMIEEANAAAEPEAAISMDGVEVIE